MNKNKVLNYLFLFFIAVGVYHLQACTVFVDVSTGGQTSTSTSGETTSSDLITTSGSTSGGVCGDCVKSSEEECDFCEYKSENSFSFCSDKNWPVGSDKGICEVGYNTLPQLDCNSKWSCDQSGADLYCKILTKSLKAQAPDFIVGEYIEARGLWSPDFLSKEGVEIISIPDEVYPTVFYYDQNPYGQSIKTLTIKGDSCLITE